MRLGITNIAAQQYIKEFVAADFYKMADSINTKNQRY